MGYSLSVASFIARLSSWPPASTSHSDNYSNRIFPLVFVRAALSSSSKLRNSTRNNNQHNTKRPSSARLSTRRFDLPIAIVLNCVVASLALHLSSASLSSSLFFSAAAASRTSLSSRLRSVIRCSFSVAFFSRSA
jgi:hypothetical protein